MKTKRIIVPIAAHVAMNTLVAIGQIFMSNEQIQEMIKEAEKMQGFIGGFFCMRNSPLFMAALYFLLDVSYTLRHYERDRYNLNVWTILFAVMATIDFNLALRLILVKFTKKNIIKRRGRFLCVLLWIVFQKVN